MSEKRAAQIHKRLCDPQIGHPEAREVSDRQIAFLVQFARRFGTSVFSLSDIEGIEFDEDIVNAYGLRRLGANKLPRQDDLTALSKHLGLYGYLVHMNGSRNFRLSTLGYEAAINAISGAEAL